MPNFKRYRINDQEWVIWNRDTESWERIPTARWYECGEPYDRVEVNATGRVYRRACSKLIGHGGEHGRRERDTMDRLPLPDGDADSDGAGTVVA